MCNDPANTDSIRRSKFAEATLDPLGSSGPRLKLWTPQTQASQDPHTGPDPDGSPPPAHRRMEGASVNSAVGAGRGADWRGAGGDCCAGQRCPPPPARCGTGTEVHAVHTARGLSQAGQEVRHPAFCLWSDTGPCLSPPREVAGTKGLLGKHLPGRVAGPQGSCDTLRISVSPYRDFKLTGGSHFLSGKGG